MAIQCNSCCEEKKLFTRCLYCSYRICMDCLINLYIKRGNPIERGNPTQIFPALNTCPTCWQYFDEGILLYIREHPDEAPIFVNVSLQYTPWNDVLKDILRGELKGQRLFDTINHCIGAGYKRDRHFY